MKLSYVLSLIALILMSFNFTELRVENTVVSNLKSHVQRESIEAIDSLPSMNDEQDAVLFQSRIFTNTKGL